ncbi:hypothetical protein IF2G_04680 [Cordyceps javanica]|nr:hypothetical protein IF2G_04680 [Cordyceps javanica]
MDQAVGALTEEAKAELPQSFHEWRKRSFKVDRQSNSLRVSQGCRTLDLTLRCNYYRTRRPEIRNS